ncbi:MAG: Zn-ribbon domain-containing OB-fold protein [Rhodospirillales bacterium]|jgi:uncharacterized OB-fold protein
MSLTMLARDFPKDPRGLLPDITPDSETFWNGLKDGRLLVQACSACSRQRWPIAPVCPHCGTTGFGWAALSGKGTVFSWIRYRRSYLPEFEDVMPYAVVTGELGPDVRMYGRLLSTDMPVTIGAPLELVVERWPDDVFVPAFRLLGAG